MPTPNPLEKKRDTQIAKNLPRQQRLAVIFLALLAILIIVFWAIQLSAQLNKPFAVDGLDKEGGSNTVVSSGVQDSDGDGLSDYEEINVYYTSPYLEDSDSDGISDKQEITQGTDPSCPVGKDCGGTNTISNPTASPTVGSTSDIIGETIVPPVGETVGTQLLSGDVTPEILRQILLQNGYDKKTLDAISDEDIMKSYQDAVSNQND